MVDFFHIIDKTINAGAELQTLTYEEIEERFGLLNKLNSLSNQGAVENLQITKKNRKVKVKIALIRCLITPSSEYVHSHISSVSLLVAVALASEFPMTFTLFTN